MGRRRKGRPVNGILLLDKARGWSSNQALQRIRRLYGAAKAGHTGSLDPLATGMLPICFGEATKLSAQLLDADKTYEVRMRLGQATDTGDADGEIVREQQGPQPDTAALEAAAQNFIGEIEQVPPMYSAVKHQGKRLYELARQGQEVERKARRVRIDAIEWMARDGDDVDWRIACSKGTYVRTLIEDIAAAAGSCAHVAALRRIRVGPFDQDLYREETLEEIAERGGQAALDACLLPASAALRDWPSVTLDADSRFYFRRGQPVQVRGAPTQGRLAALADDGRLLGLAVIDSDGRVAPQRLLELPPTSE